MTGGATQFTGCRFIHAERTTPSAYPVGLFIRIWPDFRLSTVPSRIRTTKNPPIAYGQLERTYLACARAKYPLDSNNSRRSRNLIFNGIDFEIGFETRFASRNFRLSPAEKSVSRLRKKDLIFRFKLVIETTLY